MRKLEPGPRGSRSRQLRRAPLHAAAQAGSVSLEFVILFPLLIMVLVAITDFSLMMYDKAALVTAAREAARAGTVVSMSPLTTTKIAAIATTDAQALLVSPGATSTPSATVTQANGTTSGTALTVNVSYTYNGLLLGSALSAITGPVVLNVSAVMDYE